MSRKNILSLSIGSILAAATLYLAFRNVPLADLLTYVGTIDYWWILPTQLLIVIAFVLRVFRWRLILKSVLLIDFWSAFHPLMIGFMMNNVLPGRVGELARPAILKKERNLPLSTGLATVAAERLFDMVMLIGLFVAAFSTIAEHPELDVSFGGIHLNSQMLQSIAWAMIRISIVILLAVSLLALSVTRRLLLRSIEKVAGWFAERGPFSSRYGIRLGRFLTKIVEGFAAGFHTIGNPRRLAACLVFTVLIWLATALSYYTFSLGCPGIGLSLEQMATVMVVVCFFIALPSVPGFWGLWEAGGVFALSLYGISTSAAAGYTLANHALQLFPVILIGLISALMTSVNFLQLTLDKKTALSPKSRP